MDKWLANNTAAKIIALAVAVILWAMVHVDTDTPTITRNTQGDQTTIANLAIEPYGFDDEKYVLQSINPQRVSISISGQRSQLTSLPSSSDYEVKMDLSSITEPGQYTVPLQFDPPAGVELLSIEPAKVTVTVEEKITQEFSAVVLTTGAPAAGFTELDPVFEEGSSVQVTLPASEMKEVQKVQGEISVDGLSENVSGRVKLVAYSNNGDVLEDAVIVPSSLKVQIPISSNVSSKTLPLNVSYSGRLPSGLVLADVEAGAKEVTLYGPDSVLNGLESFPPVTLDLSRITTEGATTFTESLAAPNGIDRIDPSSVEYTVTVVPYEQKVIENVPVKLTGREEGTEAAVTDPPSGRMNVTVVGASSLLDGVTASDIGLTADLSGLDIGTHDVQLDIDLPDYIETDESSPASVTVEIVSTEIEPETETTPPEEAEPETETPANTQTPEPGTDVDDESGTGTSPSEEPAEAESPVEGSTETEQPESTEEVPSVDSGTDTPDAEQPQTEEDSGQDEAESTPEQGGEAVEETGTP